MLNKAKKKRKMRMKQEDSDKQIKERECENYCCKRCKSGQSKARNGVRE